MAKLPQAKDIVITPMISNTANLVPVNENKPNGGKAPAAVMGAIGGAVNAAKPANNDDGGYNPPSGGGVTLNPTGYSGGGGYSVSGYDPSTNKAYMDAMNKLNAAYANSPTYTPSYDDEIQRLYSEIVNRGKFNYDLLSDPLYQQYREQYVNQGNMAMMDTMGQAAALTGGYGSSYSQAVGQQQYNNYLNQLNQMVPEFYDRAFNYWQAQGQDLYNQYGLVSDMRDTEYGRYRDQVTDYWNQVNYLAGRADTYYSQGADNYWNTESMNQQNYWNEQNMAFDNYWNQQNMAFDNYWKQLNYELDAYNATKTGSSSSNSQFDGTDYSSWKKSLDAVDYTVPVYDKEGEIVNANNNGKATIQKKQTQSRMIADAYNKGWIDENRFYALLAEYGISEELFNSSTEK